MLYHMTKKIFFNCFFLFVFEMIYFWLCRVLVAARAFLQ